MLVVVGTGCADLKYRLKNVNGDKTQAQMEKDWKDCYEYTKGRTAFARCTEKKGYYYESFTE